MSTSILIEFLKKSGYKYINNAKLIQSYLTHPHTGSLNSIVDTLTQFKISNLAIHIEFSEIEKTEQPFLTVCKSNGNTFFSIGQIVDIENIAVYSQDRIWKTIPKEEFLKTWTGNVILIEKNEQKTNIFFWIFPKLFYLSFAASLIFIVEAKTQSLVDFSQSLLSLSGLFISFMIIKHELGDSTDFNSWVCNLNSNTDCNFVLMSKYSKLFNIVKLSDLSIIYFAFQFFSIFIKSENILLDQTINLLRLLGVLFCVYSIYIQFFVLSKICPFCLSLVFISLCQALIVIIFNFYFFDSILRVEFLYSSMLLFLIIMSWVLFKPFFNYKYEYSILETKFLSFKRDHKIFFNYLRKQEQLINDKLPNIYIKTENDTAPVQLIFITNPLCKYCKVAEANLEELLSQFSGKINLKIIFNVNVNNEQDLGYQIAIRKLREYVQLSQNGIYKINYFFNNNSKYDVQKRKVEDGFENYIIEQVNWCASNFFFTTPLLFINGKSYPQNYEISDIKYFITELIEFFTSENDHNHKNVDTRSTV